MKKAKKIEVPEGKKYYRNRNRNNVSARLYREKKISEKIKNKERYINAKIKNKKLREELIFLEKEYNNLFFMLSTIPPTLDYNYF